MSRDPQRDLLLAKLYSRAGATAAARDYRDPDSGKVLHLTPDEWALLQYDRAHPSAVSPTSGDVTESSTGSLDLEPDDGRDPGPDRDRDLGPHGRGPQASPHRTTHGSRRSRRNIAIGTALVVVGCVIGASVVIGATQAPAGLLGIGGQPAVPAPTDEIDAVFGSGDFASADPGSLAAIGYRRDSFRLIGDEIVYDRTGQIFAAERNDGEYCLVLVSALVRTAETCATAVGIGSTGLTMSDARREGDGSLLTFTAHWNRNGQITWDLTETSH
jgi:hypothetical protein